MKLLDCGSVIVLIYFNKAHLCIDLYMYFTTLYSLFIICICFCSLITTALLETCICILECEHLLFGMHDEAGRMKGSGNG